jgi:GGDEF domain-containing protein
MSANADKVTKFMTRAEFEALAPERMATLSCAAFCIVNLLQFRNINYALGHLAGDAYLRAVEARLSSLLPADACACRVGSRFGILLPEASCGRRSAWPTSSA